MTEREREKKKKKSFVSQKGVILSNPELLLINVPQFIKTHVPDPKKLLVAF